MKKAALLTLSGILICLNAISQTFTIQHDTMSAEIFDPYTFFNPITNTGSTNIQVTWKIVDHDFPPDWVNGSFSLCDNKKCYSINNGLFGGLSFTTNDILPGEEGSFKITPDLRTTTSTGTHFLRVRMTEGNYSKDSWYFVSRTLTGITSVDQSSVPVTLFPNPAMNELNILLEEHSPVKSISIYNMSGQMVRSAKPSGNRAKLDIADLPGGIYRVRLTDADGTARYVKSFTHL